ncbi:hypothetical protein [Kitasatospora sp. NPDC088134]|uniref:hypothetical protein n=1 Tax=Kitasatospora sp. NPDC088134 TaxID=3364071 RepID=UPI00380EAFD2
MKKSTDRSPSEDTLAPSFGIAHIGLCATIAALIFILLVFGIEGAAIVAGCFAAIFAAVVAWNLAHHRSFRASLKRAYLHTFGIWQWFSGW